MSILPTERELSFEMPKGSTTTVGYNPQALARCLASIDLFKAIISEDRKTVVDATYAVGDCLCPAIYLLERESFYVELPMTKEALDRLPGAMVDKIIAEIVEDFAVLAKPYERVN
jgi:hypothetical protein